MEGIMEFILVLLIVVIMVVIGAVLASISQKGQIPPQLQRELDLQKTLEIRAAASTGTRTIY
jgi:hypothetical protein